MSLNTCFDEFNKGTVINYQVEGLDNFRGVKKNYIGIVGVNF